MLRISSACSCVIAVLTLLVACRVQPAPSQPPPAPPTPIDPAPPPAAATEPTVEVIEDEAGNQYHVSQGVPGAPDVVGCADGQREAFVDATAFPGIAGCLGSWTGIQSMRAAATGQVCGDDAGECAVPADLCAPGWRLCGAEGAVADLRQVSAEQCEQAGGGRFSAAISHCASQKGCAVDSSPEAVYGCYERGWCSETVCCGADCGQFGACRDGVWPGKTHIAQGMDQGCGATSSRRAGGVLCCR